MKKLLVFLAFIFIACGDETPNKVGDNIAQGFKKGDLSKIEKSMDYDYFIEKHNKGMERTNENLKYIKDYILDSEYYSLKHGFEEKLVVIFKLIDNKIYKTNWNVYLQNGEYKAPENNLYYAVRDMVNNVNRINLNESNEFYNTFIKNISAYFIKNKSFSDDVGVMINQESKDKKVTFGIIKPCLEVSFDLENETLQLKKINEKFPTCKGYLHTDNFIKDINPYITYKKAIKINFI